MSTTATSRILEALPPAYPFLLLTTTSSLVFSTIQGIAIGVHFRPRAKIVYPTLYATTEQCAADPAVYTYNCAQRAHANYHENLFPAVGAMLVGGLVYPRAAGALGAAWLAIRVAYFVSYCRSKLGDIRYGKPPGGRATRYGWLTQYTLYGLALTAAVKLMLKG